MINENLEFSFSADAPAQKLQKMEAEAEKGGLALTSKQIEAWKADPSLRKLPPEGKMFKHQIGDVMSGMKYEYNVHPETVLDAGNPDTLDHYKNLASGVAENSGLAHLDTASLAKELLPESGKFYGAGLIEKAGEVAEEQRLKDLGLDELIKDKGLNTGIDYGKGPKDEIIGGVQMGG